MILVGDDWSEDHHDVCVMDEYGVVLASRQFREGLGGIGEFHDLIGRFVTDPGEVVIGIETDRGLWVEALVASGYQVYAINPKSAARYRERSHVGGGKSDAGDAKMLADLVRTDRHNHRPVAGDTPGAEAIKVLARAQQSLVWARIRHMNQLRNALREYYPAALETFNDLGDRDSLAVLGRAPDPQVGARLTVTQIRSVLKRAGRQRNLDKKAAQIQQGLRTQHLTAPDRVTAAFGATTKATVEILKELNRQISELTETMDEHFEQHPDAAIYRSMPGIGTVLGARVLGEFGDDPERYADVKSRRNYAATSPMTRASGKMRTVAARRVRNDRLYDAMIRWAFCSISSSPGCRAYYDERRSAGDRHYKALRALGNHLAGILHGCLQHHTLYDEEIAWDRRYPTQIDIAA